MIVLALGVIGLVAPSSRTLQLWPDRSTGVTSALLEGMPAHADPQVFPFGVQRISAGDVVRARTYLHFPLDVFSPGTEILHATLYVYVDSVSDTGEATFGAYRVLEPWGEEGWGDDTTTWPALLAVPIADTVARFDVVTPTLRVSTPTPAATSILTPTPALTPTDTSALFSKPAGHGLVQGTMVTIDPPSVNVALGATTEVDIYIENVTDLYSAEVYMTFNPAVLEVIDADPDTLGVQIEPGTFFNLESVELNEVLQDDEEVGEIGEIYFTTYQEEPVNGSGVLATITFRAGEDVGTSDIDFDYVFLDDYNHDPIDADIHIQNGSVTVSTPTPTPTLTPTSTSTSTPGPTPTPTHIPTPGPSPTSASTSTSGPTPTSPTSPLPTPPPESGPTPTSPTSPLPTPSPIPTTPTSPLSPTVPVVALQQGGGTWLTWDVTALMRAWEAGEVPNHGLALAPAPDPDADPETAGDLLVARWLPADDPGTRPYLIVEFEVHPVTPTPAATPVPILPPAGGPMEWGAVGLLLVGVVLLALGLAARRR